MTNDRDEAGRFAAGNKGGPGRPRRAIESTYLATLGDVVGIDDWAAIVRRAVEDAKQGDSQSRQWLSRYVLGNEPTTLLAIAGREVRAESEADDADEIQQEAERQHQEQLNQQRCARLRKATNAILNRLPSED